MRLQAPGSTSLLFGTPLASAGSWLSSTPSFPLGKLLGSGWSRAHVPKTALCLHTAWRCGTRGSSSPNHAPNPSHPHRAPKPSHRHRAHRRGWDRVKRRGELRPGAEGELPSSRSRCSSALLLEGLHEDGGFQLTCSPQRKRKPPPKKNTSYQAAFTQVDFWPGLCLPNTAPTPPDTKQLVQGAALKREHPRGVSEGSAPLGARHGAAGNRAALSGCSWLPDSRTDSR